MNWHLKKRLKALFIHPKGVLADEMSELRVLRDVLSISLQSKNPLLEIVSFFNTVSKWHDRGLGRVYKAFDDVNYGQYDRVLDTLAALEREFFEAGRSRRGKNRTKRGQTVTVKDVYLGNIFGLHTAPVSYWEKHKNDTRWDWGFFEMKTMNAYDVISMQAGRFINMHAKIMIDHINQLEKVLT